MHTAETDHFWQPILVGNVNNEGASSHVPVGSEAAKASNCAPHYAALLRRNQGIPAWRYLYAGEFPNNVLGACCENDKGAW
jgi:hypothetical protein